MRTEFEIKNELDLLEKGIIENQCDISNSNTSSEMKVLLIRFDEDFKLMKDLLKWTLRSN